MGAGLPVDVRVDAWRGSTAPCGDTTEQPARIFTTKNRKIVPLGTLPPKQIKFDPASWIYCQPFEIASRSSRLLRDPPEGSLSPRNWLPPKMLPRKPPELGFCVAMRREERLNEVGSLASAGLNEDPPEEEELLLLPPELLLPELLPPELLPPELVLPPPPELPPLELLPPELPPPLLDSPPPPELPPPLLDSPPPPELSPPLLDSLPPPELSPPLLSG
ncbi:hypothetical protein [Stappia sp. BW2]|uniref:hypothetical protein n=1 Tax=Stappia sp. BW2 TaxID=2592622 RepID=UPI0013969E80|nr:hypothetical protein [Stappia sp. BW2]